MMGRLRAVVAAVILGVLSAGWWPTVAQADDTIRVDSATGQVQVVPVDGLFDAVTVPGDTETRTFVVTNTGGADGTLDVSIVDLHLIGPDDQFFRDVSLSWVSAAGAGSASLYDLEAGDRLVAEHVSLLAGTSTTLRLSYVFPWGAESGRGTNPRATWSLRFELAGDDPAPALSPSPTPTPSAPGHRRIESGVPGPDLPLVALGLLMLVLATLGIGVLHQFCGSATRQRPRR